MTIWRCVEVQTSFDAMLASHQGQYNAGPLPCALPPIIGASVLLRLDKVSLAYGSRPLLDQVSLQLDEGERVGLVGRNGEGKSSLLRLVRREAEPDAGSLWVKPGARVAHLAQDAAQLTGETVAQIVTAGLPQQREALAEYE